MMACIDGKCPCCKRTLNPFKPNNLVIQDIIIPENFITSHPTLSNEENKYNKNEALITERIILL